MPANEADALHAAAVQAAANVPDLPFVEIGTYCGRSTIWLADAARMCRTIVFTVDHHRGSEENQEGWQWHDPTLVDAAIDKMDTLPTFRRNIYEAGLEQWVVAVVGESHTVARYWTSTVSFLFIDGGHGAEVARRDYQGWSGFVASGGILAIHDVFTDPELGGQAPYDEIYRPAIDSGEFREIGVEGSLRILQCRR